MIDPVPLVTDDDVRTAVEAYEESDPAVFTSSMQAALTAAAPAMRDRWVAREIGRLAEYADAEDGFALRCADALMQRWGDYEQQAVHIDADPRIVVQVVLRAVADQYRKGTM